MNYKINTALAFILLITAATISASSRFPFVAKYKTPSGIRYTHFITPYRSVIIEIEHGMLPQGSYQKITSENLHIKHYTLAQTASKLKQIKAILKKQNDLNQKAQ
ncbi:MAG: hypothetical protein P4L31_02675 [Candidatus Babeliales bacterium]|nr:hypothetical protein [Candidatus Babeliales bacterium]